MDKFILRAAWFTQLRFMSKVVEIENPNIKILYWADDCCIISACNMEENKIVGMILQMYSTAILPTPLNGKKKLFSL